MYAKIARDVARKQRWEDTATPAESIKGGRTSNEKAPHRQGFSPFILIKFVVLNGSLGILWNNTARKGTIPDALHPFPFFVFLVH